MKRWFVVHTHPNGEFKALANIVRQGFGAYLPRYLKRRRHARKTDMIQSPLFPGYLFVEMDPEHARWRALNSTSGVSGLICQNGSPAPVPEQIIGTIRAREDAEGYVVLGHQKTLSPGDSVNIDKGAMAGHTGIFDCMTDRDRVFLLLELLGRQVRVKLPIADLSPSV